MKPNESVWHLKRLDNGAVHLRIREGHELSADDARAIIKEGQELAEASRFAMLADRRFSYSHSFEAQQAIAESNGLSAVAFLIDRPADYGIAAFAGETYLRQVPTAVFSKQETAEEWLKRFVE